MSEREEIVPVQVPASNPPEQKTLREALLALWVSPVKTEQNAITRLERVAGRTVAEIISELDNAQLIIDSFGHPQKNEWRHKVFLALMTGIFTGTIIGIVALVLQPGQIYTALLLGMGMGGSGSMLASSFEKKSDKTNFKL